MLLQSELPVGAAVAPEGRSLSAAGPVGWNPFEEPPFSQVADDPAFSQMTEDHIFGAEFDRIKRGSQTSKIILFLRMLLFSSFYIEKSMFVFEKVM